MMKKTFLFLALLSLVGLHSCNDPEDVSIDMSDCQESFDWSLISDIPLWTSVSTNEYPYITVNDYFGDTISDGVMENSWDFKCSADSTQCYFEGIGNGGLYGGVYHYDTVGWNRDCMECDDHGYRLQCKLTSEFSETINTKTGKRHRTYFHRLDRDDVQVLDTMSKINERSPYQKWWPLPREPWPFGQSRATDCLLYRDRITDTTKHLDYWNDSLPTTIDICQGFGWMLGKPSKITP